jgi:hypothetical protein
VGALSIGAVPGFGTVERQAQAVAEVNAAYATALSGISDGMAKNDGIAIGQAAAAAILAVRTDDNATIVVPYTPGTRPGDWQPTPNPVPPDPPGGGGSAPGALPGWGQVTPFVVERSSQFPLRGPPHLSSRRYANDYNEVKAIGAQNSMTRTAEQTSIARFWYEGAPYGWNRIATVVAQSEGLDSWEIARLLALIHLAMTDGFIAGFEIRYDFNFWRPVTAIRAGYMDANPATVWDETWSSFLNTPAIPDYPSTHSVLGGAASRVLRRFFEDDSVPFTTTSGAPFAGITRSFESFSQAATENGESRIYAGVHFRSAVQDGLALGKQIGAFVFHNALQPLSGVNGESNEQSN